MNAGILVEAWKSAGYCLMTRSVASPYLGSFCLTERLACGVYTKLHSLPSSSTSGGRNDSALCGTRKFNVCTWRPMRLRAASRDCFAKVPDLKVTLRSSNRKGAVFEAKSWHTRRALERSGLSRWSNRVSRQLSESQKRMKAELVDNTRWHTGPSEQNATSGGIISYVLM